MFNEQLLNHVSVSIHVAHVYIHVHVHENLIRHIYAIRTGRFYFRALVYNECEHRYRHSTGQKQVGLYSLAMQC